MGVTVHAVLLLAIPCVTAIVCLVGPRRKPSERHPWIAAVIPGFLVLMVMMFMAHLCHSGDPWAQCLIVGVSMWFLLSFSGKQGLRIGLSVAMSAAMIGLAWQYVGLVHTMEWYGHSYPPIKIDVMHESAVSHIRSQLKNTFPDATASSAGWLRDMPFASGLKDELKNKPYRYEIGRAWHTWFTRLYPQRKVEQDFWCRGGRISEGVDSIVLKDVN